LLSSKPLDERLTQAEITASLAKHVKGHSKHCNHTDECVRIPSGKRLFVTVEAQAGSPGLRGKLSLFFAQNGIFVKPALRIAEVRRGGQDL
jgi:dTDP-4-dehydrorhamnose 3,5-epimerase-like enzyme